MFEGRASTCARWGSFGTSAACVVLAVALSGCDQGVSAGTSPSRAVSTSAPVSSGPLVVASAAIRAPADAAASGILTPAPRVSEPTARERLGRAIFFDTNLSSPAGTSCAGCHDPDKAFSGNHGSTTGVALGSRPGHFARRNTPSVLYVRYAPPFRFQLADDDDTVESPFGGLTWSGRADTVAEFSRLPLLDADEMNNGSEAAIAAKLRKATYAGDLSHEFPGALDAPGSAMRALGEALQAFLTSDAMSPFSSKYDDFVRGRAQLSPLEMKGLKAFRNPDKGACNGCHLMYDTWNRPDRSLFTDYGYDAVSVPRNRAVAANADPNRYDLGLCERRQARVPSSDPQWCLRFRTPSLRNVAIRERFMHNGVFSKLRDAVAFYATRSTSPDLWYPAGATFNDAPPRYRGNVNVASLPYNRTEGAVPALNDDDIDAIVAFLQTLTDEPYRTRR
jgi:cytochrome c peroxidase